MVKQIFRYLKGTLDWRLEYKHDDKTIKVFSDADWAGPGEGGLSTTVLLVFLGGGPVIYASRRQTAIALSSTEAEYIASSEAARELTWLRQLLGGIEYYHPLPTLYIDNKSTLRLLENSDTKNRTRHIDLRYHYVRQQLKLRQFEARYVESGDQPADLLTKPMSGKKIKELVEKASILKTNESGQLGHKKTTIYHLPRSICALNKHENR